MVAADVYAVAAPHRPRRLDLVHRLGRLDVPADHGIAAGPAPGSRQAPLHAVPVPLDWSTFKIHYRYRETFYHITIRNGGSSLAVRRVVTDGNEQAEMFVPLLDDHHDHNVEVEVG